MVESKGTNDQKEEETAGLLNEDVVDYFGDILTDEDKEAPLKNGELKNGDGEDEGEGEEFYVQGNAAEWLQDRFIQVGLILIAFFVVFAVGRLSVTHTIVVQHDYQEVPAKAPVESVVWPQKTPYPTFSRANPVEAEKLEAETGNTKEQTESNQQQQQDEYIPPHEPAFIPFPDDKRYRRVCTHVYRNTTELCMTLLYPWSFTDEIDARGDQKFHDLHRKVKMLDKAEVEACIHVLPEDDDAVTEELLRTCLEDFSQEHPLAVVGVFTKQTSRSSARYYVGSLQHHLQAARFFSSQIVFVMGASPSPPIAGTLRSMINTRGHGAIVDNPPKEDEQNRNLRSFQTTNDASERDLEVLYYTLPPNKMFIDARGWDPKSHPGPSRTDLLTEMDTIHNLGKYYTKGQPLRKFSLMIEYPIAHVQTHNRILNNMNDIVENQDQFPVLAMSINHTEPSRKALANLGFELDHFFAFDGLPQFFPTNTSAYMYTVFAHEKTFLENHYDGWEPAFGETCHGPVKNDSPLKAVNLMARESFERHGMDMRWYGNIFEFANQFWYTPKAWEGKGGALDCTHSGGGEGLYYMHRYFVMAMIDEYLTEEEQKQGNR